MLVPKVCYTYILRLGPFSVLFIGILINYYFLNFFSLNQVTKNENVKPVWNKVEAETETEACENNQ